MDRLFKHKKKIECLIGWVFLCVYFFALDASYIKILGNKIEPFEINIKTINIFLGLILTTFLYFFWSILDCKRPSVFLLGIVFLVMYVPVAAIYGMMDFDSVYLFMLTIGMFIIIVLLIFDNKFIPRKKRIVTIDEMNQFIPWFFGVLTIIFAFALILKKGLPTTTAINIYNVYKLRSDSFFIKNRYVNYLFSWICEIVIPFLISIFLLKKRTLLLVLFSTLDLIFYLYSGEKAILFRLILIYTFFLLINLKIKENKYIWIIMAGLSSLCFAGMLGHEKLYGVLIRRTLFLPAHLKFLYYEFFSKHPKIGLGGTLWGSVFGIQMPYNDGIGSIISRFFFNNDAMNANTGFMAEGYYRFGFIGIILSFILLYILLKLIDFLSIKTSRKFAILFAICPIYMLNDGAIIDRILFGPLTLLIAICLIYHDDNMRDIEMNDVNYIREVKLNRIVAELLKKKVLISTVFIIVTFIIIGMHYISGRKAKTEKPCYSYTLEAYFDYDFETASIMNYAGILSEEAMVKEVAEYVGISNLDYKKADNSITVSPKAKRIVALNIIGKDKKTVSKMAQGYNNYALLKLRDSIGADEVEITDSTNQIAKIKIINYINDGKPGLVKTCNAGEKMNWDDYLYHKTSFSYFVKQGVVAGLIAVLISAFIIVLRYMCDRKIRNPHDIKSCIGEDVFAVIDDNGVGTGYITRRIKSLPQNNTDDSVLIVPVKIPSKWLFNLSQANREDMFKVSENAEKSDAFINDVSIGRSVIIAIAYGCVTDIELINIKEVLVSAGAKILGVIIVGVEEKEIRGSDEYFAKYFNA